MSIFLLSREVSDKTTTLVQIISASAIALTVVLLFILALSKKGYTTRSIVFAAVTIAASFALSFIKFTPVAYGGSITLASFVPILIYAYSQGLIKGLAAGLIFGLLNFIQSPYILVPETFILDYILAFSSIGLIALAPKFTKSLQCNFLLGTALVYAVRLVMHIVSGIIYFNYGWVIEGLPATSSFIYSLIYNLMYLVPDMLICMVALFALIKSKSFDKIMQLIKK